MMTFNDDGTMTKSLFYPESAYKILSDSTLNAGYTKLHFNDFLNNIDKLQQVIGVNEVHGVSIGRSTVYHMLPILKEKGFQYLVLEALYEEKNKELNNFDYPLKDSGWLVSEVIIGDLLRYAKELGYTLISYDVQGTGSNVTREKLSFDKIKNRIFESDPNAKIILFAGHSHVSELPIGKLIPLGVQFIEMGIDPLTITQSDYYERNVPDEIATPTLLKSNQTNEKSRFDYTLILPKSKIENGRPSWIWRMNRKPVTVQEEMIKSISEPFLIEAFIEGQSYDGIPLDRIEAINKSNLPSLALRAGNYIIRITSKNNDISEFTMKVK